MEACVPRVLDQGAKSHSSGNSCRLRRPVPSLHLRTDSFRQQRAEVPDCRRRVENRRTNGVAVGNYVLVGMIAEKASGKSFRDLVHELVIEPHSLTSTFYEASTYPESVIKRLSHAYFENEACAEYQPH
jgi:CubicO group peptidase (beta-lactamase class C family)